MFIATYEIKGGRLVYTGTNIPSPAPSGVMFQGYKPVEQYSFDEKGYENYTKTETEKFKSDWETHRQQRSNELQSQTTATESEYLKRERILRQLEDTKVNLAKTRARFYANVINGFQNQTNARLAAELEERRTAFVKKLEAEQNRFIKKTVVGYVPFGRDYRENQRSGVPVVFSSPSVAFKPVSVNTSANKSVSMTSAFNSVWGLGKGKKKKSFW